MARRIIEVAAAVIRRDDEILICSRPKQSELAAFWEFPGGKLEPGETHQQALVREIREELSVDILPGALIRTIEHDYGDKYVRVSFFESTPAPGPFHLIPRDNQDVKWVSADALDREPLLPADLPLAEFLAKSAKKA